MTREEEIRNAAEQYATHLVDTNVTDFYGNYEKKMDFVLDEYNAFLAGAKFADEHPKSPWMVDSTYVKGDIEKESESYAQGVVGDILEDIRHLLATAYIAGAKRIMK